MMRLLLFLCLFLPASARPAAAYFDFSPRAREAHRLASSLRFGEARQLLDQLRKKEEGNLIAVYIEHYMDFLTVVATDNPADYDRFRKQLLPRIDRISRGDRSAPWHLFCQAEMRLQGAMLQGRFSDYLASLNDVKLAYALLEENQRRHPGFVANQKSLGLLHTLLGSIPEEYRWTLKAMTGVKGDVALGLRELEAVYTHAKSNPDFVFGDEARILHAFLQLYGNNDREKAWQSIRSAGPDHRTNPLAAYLMAMIATRTGHNDEAIRILEESPAHGAYHPFPYRNFMLGLVKLYRLDADANRPLEAFLRETKGAMGVKEALQKLAWHRLINGDQAGYKKYMEQVKTKGADRSDTDKAALREALSGKIPDPLLTRARLLFDGAYYRKAYEMLRGAPAFPPQTDKHLEYIYRLGRTSHELGRRQEAVALYRETIASGADKPLYFACSAALYLGDLHAAQSETEKARAAYQQCLSLQPEAYAASLHARAKAAMARLPAR